MSNIKRRGFEIVSKYLNRNLHLPLRQTKSAAGYDFEAAEDVIVPSIWKKAFVKLFDEDKSLKATLIPTGIKAYMGEDEYLQLSIRSGMSLKSGLILANGVGVVDADLMKVILCLLFIILVLLIKRLVKVNVLDREYSFRF